MSRTFYSIPILVIAFAGMTYSAEVKPDDIDPRFLNPAGYPAGIVKYWRAVLNREIELNGVKNTELGTFLATLARKGDFGFETTFGVGGATTTVTLPDGKMTVKQALWSAHIQTGYTFQFSTEGFIVQVVNDVKEKPKPSQQGDKR